ncbi:glucose-1-phosphate cytidylyltransferase [candidate division WOR-1 bacterium RIFOXYB2_FULL_42_35]|uniref:Glucose-1-phosphate cytidylyltransferase n=1 Tax=candidate division WOR-1 bacterium RIFOXYC2_FULL_41_25 TaxID=1802586 RepID=A0A1F4TL41_UNCSA|nr:MAG: glucose-1-phosphate cytidylyltransferase [candidate division WOR-1 bacterium RIFOXYB2_FULL_42_35]OGC25590.1 MAG: glucose-1-phosphate cytidylyltransferase [candidate division WOR-1 bacterium RIFOXYA2_FULL_41_14]OGC33250.1 MAG: glucose-1-phosphate cytidylyltransferase [candidate division WOR-1 bacterium RIFOXYC2_FULL_41_25]OGC43366.1 MAG: glucose-1-phosphate cytidylyltransferase [candidate division WOR-1 bacterium RIFOXYD2_FULL_41_8]
MKVVILCGGQGTRLKEETEYRPKPLVPVGGMPILWHIMKTYSHYGHKDFILCLGYKGDMIKDYFLRFEELANDFTLNLRSKNERIIHHNKGNLEDWNITFINTGQEAGTAGRLAQVKEFVGDEKEFLLTYGDGVAKIDIGKSVKFHQKHGKVATITGVRPPSRFGEIGIRGHKVVKFNEKPAVAQGYINGGFMVFKQSIFDSIGADKGIMLEREPLEALVKRGQLMMYSAVDYWHCMDTYRDFLHLNDLWNKGKAPWKVWK